MVSPDFVECTLLARFLELYFTTFFCGNTCAVKVPQKQIYSRIIFIFFILFIYYSILIFSFSYSSNGKQLQIKFLSPYALSILPTAGQNLLLIWFKLG